MKNTKLHKKTQQQKHKNWATRTPVKPVTHKCSERVSRSCYTNIYSPYASAACHDQASISVLKRYIPFEYIQRTVKKNFQMLYFIFKVIHLHWCSKDSFCLYHIFILLTRFVFILEVPCEVHYNILYVLLRPQWYFPTDSPESYLSILTFFCSIVSLNRYNSYCFLCSLFTETFKFLLAEFNHSLTKKLSSFSYEILL